MCVKASGNAPSGAPALPPVVKYSIEMTVFPQVSTVVKNSENKSFLGKRVRGRSSPSERSTKNKRFLAI